MDEQPDTKQIAVLGATGSIGTSCLDIVRAHPQKYQAFMLTAHSRWQELAKQSQEFVPTYAVLTGCRPQDIPAGAFPAATTLEFGEDRLAELVALPEVDTVITGIVGAAGLKGTWAAIEAGKTIGLANKETLVVAGPLVTKRVGETNSTLIPVDSEHSAIFQALQCGHREDLQRVILTASGGPFRTWDEEKLENVSIEDALAHPTWSMGPKITIDSATMMNKSLELIEARWLFDLTVDELAVVVHPESVVHSMVEYLDGSVLAQLSPPDMKLPIQYALSWPQRHDGVSPRLDIDNPFSLHFEPPDLERFPALKLGFEVAERGGTCGAVLNAANEVAVELFLNQKLKFTDISRLCRSVLRAHHFDSDPSMEDVLRLDSWARQEAYRWNSQCRSSALTPSSS